MEVCCGCIIGMGETLEQRAELAAQLAELDPDEVPMNFLDPRPGTPFADLPAPEPRDALRAIAAFRLALPRTVLRFAGGRELTLGDLGARQGVLGGINAIIVGNYLTTLGRDPAGGPRPARRALDAGQGAVARRCERTGGDPLRRLRAARGRGRPQPLPRAPGGDRPAALLHGVRPQARASRCCRSAGQRAA